MESSIYPRVLDDALSHVSRRLVTRHRVVLALTRRRQPVLERALAEAVAAGLVARPPWWAILSAEPARLTRQGERVLRQLRD